MWFHHFTSHCQWAPLSPAPQDDKYHSTDRLRARGAKTGAYLNLPDEDHRKSYSAIEHRLSIETVSADAVKEKSVAQDVYLKRLTQVEQENESLRNLIGSLAERLGRTEAFIEMIGYEADLETGEVKYDPE